MAYFRTKKHYDPRPIPPIPPYNPPTPPIPPVPEHGSDTPIPREPLTDNCTITLYQCDDENNKLNKTLSNVKSYIGTLKVDTSKIKPTIELITTDNLIEHNYCYIDILHRYYYITDIVLCTGNKYKISLEIDVLMSHKTGIENMVCLVDRTSDKDKSYKNLFNDNQINDANKKITIKQFPNILFTDTPKHVLVVTGKF